MNLEAVLPLLIIFFGWGIKPGPHTIALVVRSISQGPRAGVAIAFGNNVLHVFYFLASFALFSVIAEYDGVISVVRVIAAVYIIWYSFYELFVTGYDKYEIKNESLVKNFIAGMAIGLINPLNASFYAGVVPDFVAADFGLVDLALASVLVFFSLLGGQMFYIAFADMVRGLFTNARTKLLIFRLSSILFAVFGVYILWSVFSG